ncbi:MAG: RluA family pseudouridine synthase [Bacillota bacterium]|nr:RluA family pseudouridine synthase [Bacillota bacterium]
MRQEVPALYDNTLIYLFDPADGYMFLRDVLISHLHLSHSLLTKLKRQQKIRVNGQITKANYPLQSGDLVTVDINLEETNHIEPQDIPLDIVYEDTDFLAVNKPSDMAIHPAPHMPDGTLANAVTYYWTQQGKTILFRPINRLDKDTSGLVLIGKSQWAHQALFQQQKQGLIHKRYQAIVEGNIEKDCGCIDLPIARIDQNRSPRTVDSAGKNAITHFTVLQRYEGFTLLSLTLETGRTHQIRVHLSHLGNPICGDVLYGTPSPFINRQALHAHELAFVHPRTGKTLQLIAPFPSDMITLIEKVSKQG